MPKETKHYAVSDIAGSIYCEQQAVFFHKYGKMVTDSVAQAANEGIASHAEFEEKGRQIQARKGQQGQEPRKKKGRHFPKKEPAQDMRCFIATCVFGPQASETNFLRTWRDNRLANVYGGKLAIKAYYTVSPKLIPIIEALPGLKKIVRKLLCLFIHRIKDSGQ